MINTPLNRAQVAEIKLDEPHLNEFPNRQNRRERLIKRNMVIQVVPIYEKKNDVFGQLQVVSNGTKQIGTKEVLHKKITNLPRQYNRMSRIKAKQHATT